MLTDRQIAHLERETEKIREIKQREKQRETDNWFYENYGTTTNTQADTFFNIYK